MQAEAMLQLRWWVSYKPLRGAASMQIGRFGGKV